MKKSDSRILITHVGSLPRGERLTDLLIEDELNPATDRTTLTEEIERRVGLVMQKQREAGVDIANDGEQGRVGFQTYVPQRMTGFGGESKRPAPPEFTEFPLFAARLLARTRAPARCSARPRPWPR